MPCRVASWPITVAMIERGVLREIPDKPALDRHVAEWKPLPSGSVSPDQPPLGII